MQYKLAIFDMDGTILNTIDDLADSVNFALREHHMPERTLKEVLRFVGNGIRRLIEQAVPEGTSIADIDAVHETFTGYYKVHCADKTRAYDGIPELLRELRARGIKTAVVSNKADYGVQALCKDYFDGLFDYAVGEREGLRRKPYPDSVLEVLKHFGLTKEEAVYIGDSEVDYQTAINSEMDMIMVGWGFREEAMILELGAPFVIHEPSEVLKHWK